MDSEVPGRRPSVLRLARADLLSPVGRISMTRGSRPASDGHSPSAATVQPGFTDPTSRATGAMLHKPSVWWLTGRQSHFTARVQCGLPCFGESLPVLGPVARSSPGLGPSAQHPGWCVRAVHAGGRAIDPSPLSRGPTRALRPGPTGPRQSFSSRGTQRLAQSELMTVWSLRPPPGRFPGRSARTGPSGPRQLHAVGGPPATDSARSQDG